MILWTAWHWLALPLFIPYDGQQYLHYASLIGSDAFRTQWNAFRTPGFPATLALSFLLFGTNALAAAAVPVVLGTLGVLVIASAVRSLAGNKAAAATLLILGPYPSLIAYQHVILTETGTFLVLALLTRLLVWMPRSLRATHLRAIALGAALAGGYLWRQTLLALMPLAAGVHALTTRGGATRGRRLALRGLELTIVVAIPLAVHAAWWSRFPLTDLSGRLLQTFALRQALLPPEDPIVASIADEYRNALADMRKEEGHAGIYWPRASELFGRIAAPASPRAALVELAGRAVRHPRRYLAGLGRTLLLFAGIDGAADENAGLCDTVLAPWADDTVGVDGPPELVERHRVLFARAVSPGLTRRVLWTLRPVYRVLVVLGAGATVVLLLVGWWRRRTALFAFAAVPLTFLLAHALLLMSIDRFAFPTHPLLLACGVVAVALTVQRPSAPAGEGAWRAGRAAERGCRATER